MKSLRIADIQTTEILYYDPQHADTCVQFCTRRKIDCLPSLDDVAIVYTLDAANRCFMRGRVDPERIVDPSDLLFSSHVLQEFQKHKLLFVCRDSELVGVVHFSDYAKPEVSIYLYEVLFDYEKSLRSLLARRGFTNESMLEYFREELKGASGKDKQDWKRKINTYDKRKDQEQYEKRPPFQSFNLNELLGLANRRGIVLDTDKVYPLRNSIMHVHELVDREDHTADDLSYDSSSFEKFCDRATQLLLDFKRVHNLWLLSEGES